jgi:hypothetical protein
MPFVVEANWLMSGGHRMRIRNMRAGAFFASLLERRRRVDRGR